MRQYIKDLNSILRHIMQELLLARIFPNKDCSFHWKPRHQYVRPTSSLTVFRMHEDHRQFDASETPCCDITVCGCSVISGDTDPMRSWTGKNRSQSSRYYNSHQRHLTSGDLFFQSITTVVITFSKPPTFVKCLRKNNLFDTTTTKQKTNKKWLCQYESK